MYIKLIFANRGLEFASKYLVSANKIPKIPSNLPFFASILKFANVLQIIASNSPVFANKLLKSANSQSLSASITNLQIQIPYKHPVHFNGLKYINKRLFIMTTNNLLHLRHLIARHNHH